MIQSPSSLNFAFSLVRNCYFYPKQLTVSLLFSSDAIYAAKFVCVIHMHKTPNFSTLTVICCSEHEANR